MLNKYSHVRFEVIMSISKESVICWDVKQCYPRRSLQTFRRYVLTPSLGLNNDLKVF
jgi:hypothetical protein